jgi:Ca2+-binding EF-hand superfamily protein
MRKLGLSAVGLVAVVAIAVSACSAASQPGADEPLAAATEASQGAAPGADIQTAQHGPAAFFAKFDSNKDGKVTAEEARSEAASRFAAADINHDGFLDAAERAAMHPGKQAEHGAKKGKAHIDRDGNGTVSRDEAPPKLLERFDQLDVNHDGVLDHQELSALHRGDNKGPKAGMGKMDADNDGKVSLAEFTDRSTRMFQHMDTDRDGAITQAELQAARPRRHTR